MTSINYTPDPSHVDFFNTNGYLIINNFVNQSIVDSMKADMMNIIDNSFNSIHSIFRASNGKSASNSEYFLNSADKCFFFVEPGAIDQDRLSSKLPLPTDLSNVTGETEKREITQEELSNRDNNNREITKCQRDAHEEYYKDHPLPLSILKPEFNKHNCLNKVGHGLHLNQNTIFYKYASSKAIGTLLKSIANHKSPVIPQSMFIFKQPFIGEGVGVHQDSTFLKTNPTESVIGLWLSLDIADEENGCLWVRPGSHVEDIRDYFEKDNNSNTLSYRDHSLPHPEGIPRGGFPTDLSKWKSVSVGPGDLVILHGGLDHFSRPNLGDRPRHSFQLHCIDGDLEWDCKNWLQYADKGQKAFMSCNFD